MNLFAMLLLCVALGQANATPDYNGLIKAVDGFKKITLLVNKEKPKLKCKCWASLDFLADQMTNLAKETKKVFGSNPSAVVTESFIHFIGNTLNSATHLIEDVWESKKVFNSLKQIANASKTFKNALQDSIGKPAPPNVQKAIADRVTDYIRIVNALTDGVRQYWVSVNKGTKNSDNK